MIVIELDFHNAKYHKQLEEWKLKWVIKEVRVDLPLEVSEEVVASIWVLFDSEVEEYQDR